MRGKRILLSGVVIALVLAITTVAIGATRHPHNGQVGGASARPNGVITGTCKATKIHFATNDVGTSTTSTTFATVPGMSVSFSIPGAVASCIVADYSGQAFAPSGGLIQIQALLDGATLGSPGVVQLVGDDTGSFSDSYSMQFAWAGVPSGAHTVSIQWKSFSGSSVAINRGTLSVQHK